MNKSDDKKTNLKKAYWPDISNLLEAKTALDSAIKGFYVVACLQACFGFFLGGATALIEPAIVAAMAFWLKKSEARWIAILLGFWSLLVIYTTFENKVTGSKSGGGTNIILAIIVTLIAITAIRATWFLSKNRKNITAQSGSDKPIN